LKNQQSRDPYYANKKLSGPKITGDKIVFPNFEETKEKKRSSKNR